MISAKVFMGVISIFPFACAHSLTVLSYFSMTKSPRAVPDYLPAGQPTRIIEIDGFVACPCGGTHIKSTADLGILKIVALKNNKKNLRVKYELA